MTAAANESLPHRARSWLCSPTTVREQVLKVSWPQSKWVCHGWGASGEWFIHQYHRSVWRTLHSCRYECQQESDIFPGPVLNRIPAWGSLGWMDFIPDKGNRVRQSRKSLIVGGAINPGQLADLFPPEGKDTSSQAVFVYLYLVFFSRYCTWVFGGKFI